MLWWSTVADKIAGLFGGPDADLTTWIVNTADEWRQPGAVRYHSEIQERMTYLEGDMFDNVVAELKDEFAQQWKQVKPMITTWPMLRYLVEKRCMAFDRPDGRIALVNSSGEEYPESGAIGKSFAAMVTGAQVHAKLADMEPKLDVAHDVAIRWWWEGDHMELGIYDPTKAHLAVNPDTESNPYNCIAYAFERSGYGGPNSARARFDVFRPGGALASLTDPKAGDKDHLGRRVFVPDQHYLSTEHGRIEVNGDSSNPYLDRHTGKPMVPFAWFRDDTSQLYSIGSHNLVRMNKQLNLGLTWLHYNMRFQMCKVPNFEVDPGQTALLKDIKSRYIISPAAAMALPPGVRLSFVGPDGDPNVFASVYEFLIQYSAMMEHINPKSMDVKGGLPTSGIALQIEEQTKKRYSDKRVERIMPQVETFLDRLISGWNHHCREIGHALIPKDAKAVWHPGNIELAPTDRKDVLDYYVPAITLGGETVDGMVAEIHNCTLAEAMAKVDENLKRTADINKLLIPAPEEPTKEDVAEDLDDLPERDEPETKDGDLSDEIDRLKNVNVYQLKVAIEAGAATPIDMRMAVFGEDEATATRKVKEAMEFNRDSASQIGEIEAARQAPVVAAKEGEGAPSEGGALPAPDEGEEPAPTDGAFDDM